MIAYETQLFKIAPWTEEVMQVAKTLNNRNFMRGRTGWIRRGIHNPESIYEHSCKVGLAAYYLFGTDEAVAKGIVHDFPEIFEKDHIPWEIDAKDKQEREFAVMTKLKNVLPNGEYWYKTWVEFEHRVGVGQHIFELDKMCPAIQAINYLKRNEGDNLEEFYPYARKKICTSQLVDLLDSLCLGSCQTEDAYETYFNDLERIQLESISK